jgi:hypothetical protein
MTDKKKSNEEEIPNVEYTSAQDDANTTEYATNAADDVVYARNETEAEKKERFEQEVANSVINGTKMDIELGKKAGGAVVEGAKKSVPIIIGAAKGGIEFAANIMNKNKQSRQQPQQESYPQEQMQDQQMQESPMQMQDDREAPIVEHFSRNTVQPKVRLKDHPHSDIMQRLQMQFYTNPEGNMGNVMNSPSSNLMERFGGNVSMMDRFGGSSGSGLMSRLNAPQRQVRRVPARRVPRQERPQPNLMQRMMSSPVVRGKATNRERQQPTMMQRMMGGKPPRGNASAMQKMMGGGSQFFGGLNFGGAKRRKRG